MKFRLSAILLLTIAIVSLVFVALATAGGFRRVELGYTIPNTDVPWIDTWFPVDIDGDGTWEMAMEVDGSPRRFGVFDPESGTWLDGPRELPLNDYYDGEDGLVGWSAGDWSDDGAIEYLYIQLDGLDSLRWFDTQTLEDRGVWSIGYAPLGLCAWGHDGSGLPTVGLLEGRTEETSTENNHRTTSYRVWNVFRINDGAMITTVDGGAGLNRMLADCPGPGDLSLAVHEYEWMSTSTAAPGIPDYCWVEQGIRLLDDSWQDIYVNRLPTYTGAGSCPIGGVWSLNAACATSDAPSEAKVSWLTGPGLMHNMIPSALGTYRTGSPDGLWTVMSAAERDARCGAVFFDLNQDGDDELLMPLTNGTGWERRDSESGTVTDTVAGLPACKPGGGPLIDGASPSLYYVDGSGLYIWDLVTDVNDETTSPPVPRGPDLTARPNPFNARVTLAWDINGAERLDILNVLGQRVRTYEFAEGTNQRTIEWDGRSLQGTSVPSGIYFARLIANNRTAMTKLVLLK